LTPLFNAVMPGISGVATSWLVALIVGLVSAYIPERMIFGRRKTKRG
jgi:ABC-type xylose transport system permease subunit